MAKRTLSIPAIVLTLAAFGVLCALGVWQLERLQWKNRVLNDLNAAYATGTLPLLMAEDIDGLAGSPMPFARGTLQGRYDNVHETLVGPRTWRGQTGYHVLTPLQLERGGVVIVNRGWIPEAARESADRPGSVIEGYVSVSGLLRRPETPNMFVPANNPATGTWYHADLQEISVAHKLRSVAPLILYAEQETGMGSLPIKEALRWQPPNNHLSYAIFWFTMAGTMLVIFYLRFIRIPGA